MFVRIDISTGVPIWQQIVQQVTRQAVSGSLERGRQLPPVRDLARELRVNPNTVARAYQELERDGVVETRRGSGTFACDVAASMPFAERNELIASRIDSVLTEAVHLHLDAATVNRIFSERVGVLDWAPRQPEPAPADPNDDREVAK